MSATPTVAELTAKIARLEAAALRNLDAMDKAIQAQEAAREVANDAAVKEASTDFHAALCNHLRAADAAQAFRLRLAALTTAPVGAQ